MPETAVHEYGDARGSEHDVYLAPDSGDYAPVEAEPQAEIVQLRSKSALGASIFAPCSDHSPAGFLGRGCRDAGAATAYVG